MPDEKNLIPLFIPPLAVVLAASELKKGGPLTQAETEAIRDNSVCIMWTPEDAQKMTHSRGYIDVNPENCWADWHRLRPQMTGGYLPNIVLCIPGGDDLRRRCEPILRASKVEHEFRPHDPKIEQAFKYGSKPQPSLTPGDFSQLASHTTVLYAMSGNFAPAAAEEKGISSLKLGRQLLDAGGIAIKCESSGIAHSAGRWAKICEIVDRTPEWRWTALFDAYVDYPIGSQRELYTCGMHLLGASDLIIATSTLVAPGGDGNPVAAACQLFRSLGVYLVSECPVGRFAPGHTFRMDEKSTRYRATWEPCEGYPEDNFFFNPFGRWRLATL